MPNESQPIQDAMRLASSPAGQELLRILQQSNRTQLNEAMQKAANGDYAAAKALLANLLTDPKARELLTKLGGNYGPDGR